MKKIVAFLLACFFTVSVTSQPGSASDNFKKLHWLVGEWKRTNTKPGTTGVESWVAGSSTEMHGIGVTIKGNDTTASEKLKLVVENDHIFYVADVKGNKAPVYFKVTKISAEEFVCENQQHDFPKVITYKRAGESFKATISGDGKAFDYVFERIL